MINESVFSREQATVFYDQKKEKWFIKDGGQEKLSTCGTW